MDKLKSMLVPYETLWNHVVRQLSMQTCLEVDAAIIDSALPTAINRSLRNFTRIKNKRYSSPDGGVIFNPSHTGQYCIFLYYLAHTLNYEFSTPDLADVCYGLNKALHGCDIHPCVNLPEYFYLEHPVGTVLGKAKYGNYFQCRQNNTVGNKNGLYPTFGENVHLWSGASVIGNCNIGDNVIIGAGALLISQDVPSNSVAYGRVNDLVIKSIPEGGGNYFF